MTLPRPRPAPVMSATLCESAPVIGLSSVNLIGNLSYTGALGGDLHALSSSKTRRPGGRLRSGADRKVVIHETM
jgi:hypothetical protein